MPKRVLANIVPPDVPRSSLPRRLVPMLLVAYACLLPRELALDIAGATLFPYRLALILMAPLAVSALARYPVRPSSLDFVVAFASIWFSIALYFTTSPQAALISGGASGLDLGLAYLVGRSAIRTPQDFRTLLVFFIPGLLGLLAVMAAESLSHRIILRPMLASLRGLPPPDFVPNFRLGLLRAMGPFPHPILGGVFLAALLPLAWYWSHTMKQRVLCCGIACGAVFTMSAAALLALLIGGSLILLQVAQRLTRIPVALIAGFYGLMASLAIAVGSQNGLLSFLIRRFTLDPQSGFYRLTIWEYAGSEVLSSPLVGIGQRDWSRPFYMPSNSVDSYWLFLSLTYGIPAAASALILMIGALISILVTQKFRADVDRHVARGALIFLAVIMFCGLTVHLWENLHGWVILFCGGAVSLATQARTVGQTEAPPIKPAQFAPDPAYRQLGGAASMTRPQ